MKKAALWAQRLFTHSSNVPSDSLGPLSSSYCSASSAQHFDVDEKTAKKPRSIFGYQLKSSNSTTTLANPSAVSLSSSSSWGLRRTSRTSASTTGLPFRPDTKTAKGVGGKQSDSLRQGQHEHRFQRTKDGGTGDIGHIVNHSKCQVHMNGTTTATTPTTSSNPTYIRKRFSTLHVPFGPRRFQSADDNNTGGGRSRSSSAAPRIETNNLLLSRPIVDNSTAPFRRNSLLHSVEDFKRLGQSLTGAGNRARECSSLISSSVGTHAAGTNALDACPASTSSISLPVTRHNKSIPLPMNTAFLPALTNTTTTDDQHSSAPSLPVVAVATGQSNRMISSPIYVEPAPIVTPLRPPPQPPISQPLPPLSPALVSSSLLPDLTSGSIVGSLDKEKQPHRSAQSLSTRPLEIRKNTRATETLYNSLTSTNTTSLSTPISDTAISAEWASDKALQLLRDLTDRVDGLSKLIHNSKITAAALTQQVSGVRGMGARRTRHQAAHLLPNPPEQPIPPLPSPSGSTEHTKDAVIQDVISSSSMSSFSDTSALAAAESSSPSSLPKRPSCSPRIDRFLPLYSPSSSNDMFVTAAVLPLTFSSEEGKGNEDKGPASYDTDTMASTTADADSVATVRATLLTDLVLEVQREIRSCRSSITSALMSPLMSHLNQQDLLSTSALVNRSFPVATSETTNHNNGRGSDTKSKDMTVATTTSRSHQGDLTGGILSLGDFGLFQSECAPATLAGLSVSNLTSMSSESPSMSTVRSPVTAVAMPTSASSSSSSIPPLPTTSTTITATPSPQAAGYGQKQLVASPQPLPSKGPLSLSSSTMNSFAPLLSQPTTTTSNSFSSSSTLSSSTESPLTVMQKMGHSLQQLEARVVLYEQEWPCLVGMLLCHEERLTRLETEVDGDDTCAATGALTAALPEASSFSSSSPTSMAKDKHVASLSAADKDGIHVDACGPRPYSPFSSHLAMRGPKGKFKNKKQPPSSVFIADSSSFPAITTSSESVVPPQQSSSSSSTGLNGAAAVDGGACPEKDGNDDYSQDDSSSLSSFSLGTQDPWPFWDQDTVQSLMAEIRALRARVEAQDGEWHRKYCDLHEEVLQHMYGQLSDHDGCD